MIELKDIHVTFNKDTPLETKALRGVDLAVTKGEFLTVIGSNGAGKSTSLNVMAGIAPVLQGSLRVGQNDMTNWPVQRRARSISRVFQDPKMGTCEDLTILENFALAYGRTSPRGFKFAVDPSIRSSVAERLSVLKLGLEDRLDDKVDTQVLLLDEHTAALDPKTADFVLQITNSIVRELKLTAVMVTHSMAQALNTGDRTIMFHQGKIIFDVAGVERDKMTVEDLLHLFKREQGEELADDSLLLD
jgi:putative ABC transport system ATP-binding protein